LSVKDYIRKVYKENPVPQEEDGATSFLPADDKNVPECEGILDGNRVIAVPHQNVFIDFDGLIKIAAFDKTSGVIPY
jgi:hypothetical protein